MIDVNNAEIRLSKHPERGGIVVQGELALKLNHFVPSELTPQIDSNYFHDHLENAFKSNFQNVIYGDPLKAMMNAYGVSLEAAWACGPFRYEQVKAAFARAFQAMKVPVPAHWTDTAS